MKYLILLGLLVGCNAPLPTADEQAVAMDFVWNVSLGMRDKAPPAVEWRLEGPCLREITDICADGKMSDDFKTIVLYWHGNIPDSAFTHELIHARDWWRDHKVDSNHAGPQWYSEERINKRLREVLSEL